ncbi:putative hydrolase [Gordonia effusa NBRC 100432]|uniref:Putative hydrolase n=2 Tax=Gordonia effusa TaxID=263908 RepID=H0R313_9ACTN|nr:putative hydrolase [Gordonia effusa NBRC 100432]
MAPVPTLPAMRATLIATLTRQTLGRTTGVIPMNAGGIRIARGLVAGIMRVLGPTPSGTTIRPVSDDGVRGEWVLGPGVRVGDRAIYYVHGSAFVICSARTHRGLAARLSAATGLPVFVVDYRLAPEHRFPTAADDVEKGYRWLIDQGYNGSDLAIAGDSAGGHLICDLLANADLPPDRNPAAAVLFSPLIDLTLALAENCERKHRDPAISASAARRLVDLYTRGQSPHNPRLRLNFTAAQRMPPFLVQVGSAEMLADDARHVADEVTKHGGTATLEIWPAMMHVFQALPRLGPDADAALLRVRDFIQTAFAARPAELDKECS